MLCDTLFIFRTTHYWIGYSQSLLIGCAHWLEQVLSKHVIGGVT